MYFTFSTYEMIESGKNLANTKVATRAYTYRK